MKQIVKGGCDHSDKSVMISGMIAGTCFLGLIAMLAIVGIIAIIKG